MLPLIKAGVLAMKGLNLTAKIAPLMFGIPPGTVPAIPPASMRKADELIHGLEAESEEFACVAEAAGDALKGASLTELSQHQLHEFEQFLKLHDPHESWKSQLVRVVLQSGSVLWVSPEGKKKVDLLELRAARAQEAGAAADHGGPSSTATASAPPSEGRGRVRWLMAILGTAVLAGIIVAALLATAVVGFGAPVCNQEPHVGMNARPTMVEWSRNSSASRTLSESDFIPVADACCAQGGTTNFCLGSVGHDIRENPPGLAKCSSCIDSLPADPSCRATFLAELDDRAFSARAFAQMNAEFAQAVPGDTTPERWVRLGTMVDVCKQVTDEAANGIIRGQVLPLLANDCRNGQESGGSSVTGTMQSVRQVCLRVPLDDIPPEICTDAVAVCRNTTGCEYEWDKRGFPFPEPGMDDDWGPYDLQRCTECSWAQGWGNQSASPTMELMALISCLKNPWMLDHIPPALCPAEAEACRQNVTCVQESRSYEMNHVADPGYVVPVLFSGGNLGYVWRGEAFRSGGRKDAAAAAVTSPELRALFECLPCL